MEKLISALQDLEVTIRNMQGHLREEFWPSESLLHAANDAIVWLGMTASAVENLRTILEPLEEAKEEVHEIIKEEEGGKNSGEQVQQPADSAAGAKVPVLEPEAEPSKGSKRVRKREG